MEEARVWMWGSNKSNSESNFVGSWEEEAFAEDAVRPFGAFIWPPRSYNCSFCRKEFKSAQALGGHMNVHRKDRARIRANNYVGASVSFTQERSSSYVDDDDQSNMVFSTIHSRCFKILDFGKVHEKKRKLSKHDHDPLSNLGVGLGMKKEMADGGCKKRRIADEVSLPSFILPSTMEDLDLELRLGFNLPKVMR